MSPQPVSRSRLAPLSPCAAQGTGGAASALCSDSYLPISGGSWCSGAAAGLSSGCRWSGCFRPRGAALNCVQESRVCAVGKAAGAPEFGAGVCFSSAVPRPGCDVVCGAEWPSERLLVLERSAGLSHAPGTRAASLLHGSLLFSCSFSLNLYYLSVFLPSCSFHTFTGRL